MNKNVCIHFFNKLGKIKIIGVFKRVEVTTVSSMNETENQYVCDICDLNNYSIRITKYNDEEMKNIPKIYI